MKGFTILTLTLISATFALDLQTVQKNSQRYPGYLLPAMDKRRIQMPAYINMFNDHKDDQSASRLSDTQQYYRRLQELLANIVSQENRRDATWLENLRQRDVNLRHLTDIRPPYDQDDFPAYSQTPQEETLRWAPPLPQLVRPPAMEKRPPSYRSHKQLPFTTRVPAEEMVKKRSIDNNRDHDNEADFKHLSSPKNQKNEPNKRVSNKMGNKVDAVEQALANVTSGNKMSPDQFQQWLTDEYYRNMAMSFATMRKRRSVIDHSADMILPAARNEGMAFYKLRLIEQSLLQDALRQMLQRPGRYGTKQ